MKLFVRFAVVCAVVLSLAVPAFAGDDVIHKGADVWMTVAGFARTSFEAEPIPAGFFCTESAPFTGSVAFKGAPLKTEPARSLGDVDTIVRRLDDAVLNEKGEGSTRIQFMALSLVSVEPIRTACGAYDVAVTLAGEQPTTTMKIIRTEALGGTYTAPLALNVKAVFTPVTGHAAGRRELTRRIELGPANHSVWTYVQAPQYKEKIRVDTNGDGRADAAMPAATNFLAGVSPAVLKGSPGQYRIVASTTGDSATPIAYPLCPRGQCPYQSCHCNPTSTNPYEPNSTCDPTHMHCTWVCVTCTMTAEPVSPSSN